MKQQIDELYIVKIFLIILVYIAVDLMILSAEVSLTGTVNQSLIARTNEAVSAIVAVICSHYWHLNQRYWGLTVPKKQQKSEFLLCAACAAAIIGLFYLVRLGYGQMNQAVAARPWFGLYLGIHMRFTYLPSAFLQECAAKGVLQHALEKILPKEKWYLAVLLMACIFSIIHTHLGLYYQLGAFAISVITGMIYHKRQNVYTCAVIHFLIGFMPRVVGLK